MTAKHITIKGRVQGVFFRRNAQQKADELNITGWVKNMEDDTVEIVAQGEENELQQFIEWCKEGPSKAIVENVEIKEKETDKSFRRFSIVY
jgi:acylphosphatase